MPCLTKKGRKVLPPLTLLLLPIKSMLLLIRVFITPVTVTFVCRVIVSSPAAVFASKMALLNVPATVPVPLSFATVTSKLASVYS